MSRSANIIDVYLEIGKKRTFASALDWPGWSRVGRDEGAALQALVDYGPRYARVLRPAQIAFQAPTGVSALAVVERLEGNTTTDFGAPDVAPSSDTRPIDETELRRFQTLLHAYWRAFDAAVQAASGQELRTGPRGGGRTSTESSSMCWAPRRAISRGSPGSARSLPRMTCTRSSATLIRLSSTRWQRQCAARCPRVGRVAALSGHRATSFVAWPGMCLIISGRSRTAFPDGSSPRSPRPCRNRISGQACAAAES